MAYLGTQSIIQKGASISAIDGTTTGSTLIFTPAALFTPTNIIVTLTGLTGFAVVASCSIGTNGASYNNILPITVLTGMSSVNNILNFPLSALISNVAASTGIYINITTGAVSTTYVLKATIIGYYL